MKPGFGHSAEMYSVMADIFRPANRPFHHPPANLSRLVGTIYRPAGCSNLADGRFTGAADGSNHTAGSFNRTADGSNRMADGSNRMAD